MIRPQILTGMKKPHNFTGALVDGRYIAAFVPVINHTRVGQVFDIRKAAMFVAEDVIDMRPKRDIVFVDQAVLPTTVRPAGDFIAERLAYIIAHWQESGARVL